VQARPRNCPKGPAVRQLCNAAQPPCEKGYPCDARRQVYWCRLQSPAATFVGKIADRVPIGVTQLWNQTLPLEARVAQAKWARRFPFGDDFAQSLFDQPAQGCPVAGGDFSRLT
jgi:hypothetical protein